MCLSNFLSKKATPQRDPRWWTIYSQDGWDSVPAATAEKIKADMRHVMSSGPVANLDAGGMQKSESVAYWKFAGCPPTLKSVTPAYYTREDGFSFGDPKWFVHEEHWKI